MFYLWLNLLKKDKQNRWPVFIIVPPIYIYICVLPSKALIKVISSVYSRSPPTGIP